MANEQIIQLGNATIGLTDLLVFDRASDSVTLNCTVTQLRTAIAGAFALLAGSNTFTVGPQVVVIDDDAHQGVRVKCHSATQSASPLVVTDSTGTSLFGVDPTGTVGCAGNLNAGASIVSTFFIIGTTGVLCDGPLSVRTAGQTVGVKTGGNACIGSGTLSGGTVTVGTSAVTVNSVIIVTRTGGGTPATFGNLRVSSTTPGSDFSVTSSSITDDGTFDFLIVEKIP